jgi:hypothetical protein
MTEIALIVVIIIKHSSSASNHRQAIVIKLQRHQLLQERLVQFFLYFFGRERGRETAEYGVRGSAWREGCEVCDAEIGAEELRDDFGGELWRNVDRGKLGDWLLVQLEGEIKRKRKNWVNKLPEAISLKHARHRSQ